MRKLNLGCGEYPVEGYENIDIKTGHSIYPLEEADNSVDEIRASHVLEHFSHREIQKVFAEWCRALKPGGLIKIAVPDFDLICRLHTNGQLDHADLYLMGGHIDEYDQHGTAFTDNRLCQLFFDAGLEDVREWPADCGDCSALPISLNLQGRKPLSEDNGFEGVYGVFPSARYGPSLTHRCLYDVLAKLNIKLRMTSGCFWNQHICPAMEEAANESDSKYIMTFDFDSVFTESDLLRMYRIMETHPHIDALAPMQSSRGVETPLFTTGAATMPKSQLDGLSFTAKTAHFGLTFIRADKLKTLPHPWMKGEPDARGKWGPDRIDPDIWFWRQWEKAGHSLHVTPQVSIGHIDEMILWPARDGLKPVYQKSSDYFKFGKPLEAL